MNLGENTLLTAGKKKKKQKRGGETSFTIGAWQDRVLCYKIRCTCRIFPAWAPKKSTQISELTAAISLAFPFFFLLEERNRERKEVAIDREEEFRETKRWVRGE
jgi:hypothetical protein